MNVPQAIEGSLTSSPRRPSVQGRSAPQAWGLAPMWRSWRQPMAPGTWFFGWRPSLSNHSQIICYPPAGW